jgi:Uma2 family endonuclease
VATHLVHDTVSIHRFTYEDVVAMEAAGILDDTRMELVDGVLYDMSPAGPRHAKVVEKLTEQFVIGARRRYSVRVQDGVLTPDGGWRSPDLMVITRDDGQRLPDTALLVIEVASSSRGRDIGKASVYAEIDVHEYWIVDVDRDEVLVHRDPSAGEYASVERFAPGDTIAALIDLPPVDLAALLAR